MRKTIIYGIALFAVMFSVSVFAQEPVKWIPVKGKKIIAQPGEFEVQKGDTVVISKDQKYYLSGDTIRKWVYNVCLVVDKVGGQRFPDGIRLRDIYSWISPNDLSLIGPARSVPAASLAPAAPVVDSLPVPEPPAPVAPVVDSLPAPEPPAPAAPVVDSLPVPEPPAPAAPVVIEPVQKVTPAPKAASTHQPTVAKVRLPHENRFSLGIRGGVVSMMQQAENINPQIGFDALLDLQYAYYTITVKGHKVGFLVGAGAGYMRSSLQCDALRETFTCLTTDGSIDYTITADAVVEKDGIVVVEVPFMFSWIAKGGFFLNVGPRIQAPVYSHYDLQSEKVNIDAYFPKERVHVLNEMITGRMQDNKMQARGTFVTPYFNVLVGAELGYEWTLKSHHTIALGVYADYAVYAYNRPDANNANGCFDLTPPSATTQPAQVSFRSLQDAYGTAMGFWDAGIKLTYHLNSVTK